MKKLEKKEIEQALKNLKDWEYHENTIQGSFEFKDFKTTFSLMTRIAFEAEAQQHHPEWTNVYNKLSISLSTHDANGVTQKDIDLAKTITAIIKTA